MVARALDPTANLDVLWKTSLLFDTMRPAWAGMMQVIHQGNHKGKSSITFLPMIDMNQSDVTCVSSTLKFVSEHGQRHNIANPIVTFDQPLWWKAFNIIQTEPADSDLRKMILRLGAFHTEMSFLGTIGHLMAGSGLRELLELIYASNAVDHILTGKAIARAVLVPYCSCPSNCRRGSERASLLCSSRGAHPTTSTCRYGNFGYFDVLRIDAKLAIKSLHFVVDEPAVHDENVPSDDITQPEQNGK